VKLYIFLTAKFSSVDVVTPLLYINCLNICKYVTYIGTKMILSLSKKGKRTYLFCDQPQSSWSLQYQHWECIHVVPARNWRNFTVPLSTCNCTRS